MVRRRQSERRGRRLQSGSLRHRRNHIGRASRRADGAGDFRSGRPHDRAIPHRHGGRGRLPDRRSRRGRRQAGRAAHRSRSRARDLADARPARRLRAQSHRMSRAPAQGPRPLRSGDAHAGRASRFVGQARSRRLAPLVRRQRRRSRRHDRRDPQSQSQAGPRLRLDHGAADRAGCVCAGRFRRRLAGRAQFRHAAESPHQPAILRASVKDHAQRQGQDLSGRLSADRDLAGARTRSTRQDYLEGVQRDRAPAGRFLRQRCATFATAQSQDRRRRHRHARVRPSRE